MIDKVLIVEDELDIRFLLKQYFKSKGLSVLEAKDLKSATEHIEILDQATLVTLDLNLPDGSGFLFLEKLTHLNKKCKVIVCSAYSDLSTKALSLGADAFVAKPIMMKVFDEFLEIKGR